MTTFGIELDETIGSKIYFEQCNKRWTDSNLWNNPFIGSIKMYGKGFAVLQLKNIWFNFPAYAAISGALLWLFTGWLFFAILAGLCLVFSLLWLPETFFLALKLGLKKNGYRGRIVKLPHEETIQRLTEELDKRKDNVTM